MAEKKTSSLQLLSIPKCAKKIDVSLETLKGWIKYKGLPTYQLPGVRGLRKNVKIRIDDVENWLADRKKVNDKKPRKKRKAKIIEYI